MRIDYHMHFEYGSYDLEWVKGFFEHAAKRGIDEIGISEHSHTFVEFQPLYEQDLILDDSEIGRFQKEWLKKGKFRYRLRDADPAGPQHHVLLQGRDAERLRPDPGR